MSAHEVDKRVDMTGYWNFLMEFKKESDRAAVILGAAQIDTLLRQILLKYLMPNPSKSDELFDGEAPLASFSARINLIFRLGFITPNYAHALHMIRKIRNDFAHEVFGCSIESCPHRDRAKELISHFDSIPSTMNLIMSLFQKDTPGVSEFSARFRTAFALVAARLEFLLSLVFPLKPISGFDLIATSWLAEETKAIEPSPNLAESNEAGAPKGPGGNDAG